MKKMKPKVMKRLQIEMERTPYIKKSIEDSNDKIENISNLIKDKKSSLSQEMVEKLILSEIQSSNIDTIRLSQYCAKYFDTFSYLKNNLERRQDYIQAIKILITGYVSKEEKEIKEYVEKVIDKLERAHMPKVWDTRVLYYITLSLHYLFVDTGYCNFYLEQIRKERKKYIWSVYNKINSSSSRDKMAKHFEIDSLYNIAYVIKLLTNDIPDNYDQIITENVNKSIKQVAIYNIEDLYNLYVLFRYFAISYATEKRNKTLLKVPISTESENDEEKW